MLLITKKAELGVAAKTTAENLAISAYILKENINVLKKFADNHIRILVQEQIGLNLMSEKPRGISANFVFWSNEKFLLVEPFLFKSSENGLSWEELSLAWILFNTTTDLLNEVFIKSVNDIGATRMLLIEQNMEIAGLYSKMIEVRQKKIGAKYGVDYFNVSKFLKSCKDQKIKAKVISNGKVLLSYQDIILGNDKEGKIIYNNINILVYDWRIDGFNIRFKDFDYSSYWNLPFITLHPYLSVPYCFNQLLTWLNWQDYDDFAESINIAVTQYHSESGIKYIRDIVDDIQELRKIWNNLRTDIELISDRKRLSKKIFETYGQNLEKEAVIQSMSENNDESRL
jgi:hypothetical protein